MRCLCSQPCSPYLIQGLAATREEQCAFVCGVIHSSAIVHMPLNSVCAQSCPALCDPMDCSPPGPSVHGIFQVRILEWVAISSSRRSSWLRDRTCISYFCIGWFLYPWATWEVLGLSLLVQWCNCGHGSLFQDAFLLLPLLVCHFGFPGDDADCHSLTCLTQNWVFLNKALKSYWLFNTIHNL